MGNKFQPLNKKKDFAKIYKDGAVLREQGVILRYIRGKSFSRLAFSISKKVVSKAVRRNKIKRWMRAIIRDDVNLQNQNLDIWIFITKEINTYEECKKTLEKLLFRATDQK